MCGVGVDLDANVLGSTLVMPPRCLGCLGVDVMGLSTVNAFFSQMISPSRDIWAWNGQSTVSPINLVRVFVCPSTPFISPSWQNREGNRVT